MTAATILLVHLRQLGATVAVIDGRLRIEAPRGAVSPAMRRALADHKSELIAVLDRSSQDASSVTDPDECLAQISRSFAALAGEYVGGALQLIANDATLQARLDAAAAALDRVVEGWLSERAFQAALDAYVGILREACQRLRARQECAPNTRLDSAAGTDGIGPTHHQDPEITR